MSFKTPILCDRRVFDKRGKWKNPTTGLEENIFYYVKEALTIVPNYDGYKREELAETTTIVVFGGKRIIKEDSITLENGAKYKVHSFTINYFESNVLVKDMLKPRIESMELVLE